MCAFFAVQPKRKTARKISLKSGNKHVYSVLRPPALPSRIIGTATSRHNNSAAMRFPCARPTNNDGVEPHVYRWPKFSACSATCLTWFRWGPSLISMCYVGYNIISLGLFYFLQFMISNLWRWKKYTNQRATQRACHVSKLDRSLLNRSLINQFIIDRATNVRGQSFTV